MLQSIFKRVQYLSVDVYGGICHEPECTDAVVPTKNSSAPPTTREGTEPTRLSSTPAMSSTSALTPTSEPLPSPSDTDNVNGGVSQGANYFFGFLITFIVLLLIFVACGVGSRRRVVFSRRGGLAGGLATWDLSRDGPSNQPEPTFREACLENGGPKWSTMVVSNLPRSFTLAHRARIHSRCSRCQPRLPG
jgi:hypothetical protein